METKELPEYVIGRKYHLSWAKNRGYVWVLISFNAETNFALLETPKTHKQLRAKLSDLTNINKHKHKIQI